MAKNQPRSDADRRLRQCERLGRLLRVLQLIMGKGRWDADGLAQELECSRRTVYRLLQTLSLAGVPWYFDDSCRAYRVRPGFKFPAMDLAPATGVALLPKFDEVATLIDNVIQDGEAFATSLRQLLDTLHGLHRNT